VLAVQRCSRCSARHVGDELAPGLQCGLRAATASRHDDEETPAGAGVSLVGNIVGSASLTL
jgi:hypothetical protein